MSDIESIAYKHIIYSSQTSKNIKKQMKFCISIYSKKHLNEILNNESILLIVEKFYYEKKYGQKIKDLIYEKIQKVINQRRKIELELSKKESDMIDLVNEYIDVYVKNKIESYYLEKSMKKLKHEQEAKTVERKVSKKKVKFGREIVYLF